MKELICITCPKGCRLQADDAGNLIVGAGCPKGIEYAKKELTSPTRVITSTVCVEGAKIDRLPVKTDRPVPKSSIFSAMRLLDAVIVHAPIKIGDVIIPRIPGTDASFVATRTLLQREDTPSVSKEV